MADLERIPAEARWKIATRGISTIPVAYHAAVYSLVGAQYDKELNEIGRKIWREAGKEQKVVAKAFGFPTDNAKNVGETFIALSRMFAGPEMKGELVEEAGDRAVITVEGCPFVKRSREQASDPKLNYTGCVAYMTAAVECLNPEYEIKATKSMCAGDSVCELWIQPQD